jgi:hypothetical protein
MEGTLKLGDMDTHDFARIGTIAKSFASTIQWVSANIKIVVPEGVLPAINIMIGSRMAAKTYVVLNDNEKAYQAQWEVDQSEIESRASHDLIREHEIACWNSVHAPHIFHPTVLRPRSQAWQVEIVVRIQRPRGPRMVVTGHVHPNSCFSTVARYVTTLVNPTGELRRHDQIEIDETGEIIDPTWKRNYELQHDASSIASSTLKVPVRVNYIIQDNNPP